MQRSLLLVPALVLAAFVAVSCSSGEGPPDDRTSAIAAAVIRAVVTQGTNPAEVRAPVFVAAAVLTLQLPPPAVRPEVAPTVQYEELHTPTIVATAWAFTVVRFAVGFFVFGLAFDLRRGSQPAWMYGAAVAAYGAGTFGGLIVAPLLRRRYGEDRLTAGSLVVLAVVAAFGALGPSRSLVLVVSDPGLLRVFEVVGLDGVMEIHDTLSGALA